MTSPTTFNRPEPIRQRTLLRALSVCLFLALWHFLSVSEVLNEKIIPGPVNVARAMIDSLKAGQLQTDILDSLRRVSVGYLVGAATGVFLGVLAAFRPVAGALMSGVIDLLRPIPPIAWIPISLLWFGFGDPSAYFLVSLGAFFPVFTNSFLAVSAIEQGSIDVARCHGASRSLVFWRVIMPQALPTVFGGLRIGMGVAWMVVITAELTGSQSGLGYLIQVSRAQLQAESVIAGMVLIGIIGYGLVRLMDAVESWLMPWKGRGRELRIGPAL